MSLVTIAPHFLNAWPFWGNPSVASRIVDAAGESVFGIGQVYLSSGPGTSKTISSAGGKVYILVGSAVTFVNAGTTIRIGVQDLTGAPATEDGTFDVFDDLVGGTDPITGDAILTGVMSSGTKTITHGDYVAIGVEMTALGGADTVRFESFNAAGVNDWPACYVTQDTGGGPAVSQNQMPVAIEFDDGTLGILMYGLCARPAGVAFNSGDAPDEFATIFQVPYLCSIAGINAVMDNVASTDDFEAILYSDPLGTPSAERTVTANVDAIVSGTSDGTFTFLFSSAFNPVVGTDYAIAIRPTTVNDITLHRMDFTVAALRFSTQLGTLWRQGSRTNQTGAFTEDTTIVPCIGPILSAFSDGKALHAHTHLGIG